VKKKKQRITIELIKRHFGNDVKIKKSLGGVFRVTTPTGGSIEIKQDGFRLYGGGEDVYRAITLLAADCWGGFKASGPREHILACMAHGEALSVQVTPDGKQSGGGCARISGAFMVAMIGLPASGIAFLFGGDDAAHVGMGITAIAVLVLWLLMAREQKEQERRRSQEMRSIFPVVHGLPRDASLDDADRQGWL
jgi:hypothetical protein